MTTAEQPCFCLLSSGEDGDLPTEETIRADLENNDVRQKAEAMKKLIRLMINGERYPSLLMVVIRFVMPVDNHELKKLLLVFWEVVPKTTSDGKLMQEMILVCDAYRKDLQHPNEFIRGSTLRFLCKLKEPELIEPLMPSILNCLEHRHAYVRRNAVLAIYTIYKNFDMLIPDAPELMQNFLEKEKDPSCQRNAFMMLIHVDQNRALDHLSKCIDQLQSFNDILQLVIVELVYNVCYNNPGERSRFIFAIYQMLGSSSGAVRYEAAGALIMLSNTPTGVKAAAQCYIELILKESENNVKLIVLDRLVELKQSPATEKVLRELTMDFLRVLSTPAFEVRRKALDLAMDLVTARNVVEVVQVLRKEASKTNDGSGDDNSKYRQLLVKSLHRCSIKYPEVAPQVIPLLVEFLSDCDKVSAMSVLEFVREVVQTHESLRLMATQKVMDFLPLIKDGPTVRAALWILGEYCTVPDIIDDLLVHIKESIGEYPIVDAELRDAADESKSSKVYPIRVLLLEGKFFVGAALASTLTKLALRYIDESVEEKRKNQFCAEVMLIISSILHLGRTSLPAKKILEDDAERLGICLQVIAERSGLVLDVFRKESRSALENLLASQNEEDERMKTSTKEANVVVQVDDPISFSQLTVTDENVSEENRLEASLLAATGIAAKKKEEEVGQTKLSKVHQLTGLCDAVYAEAYIHVHQFDVVFDMLVVNQTADVLQGLTVELATLGNLKLMERPQPCTLAPHDFTNIKTNIKVASTENAVIFGNIVYDVGSSQSDRSCVVLNDIHIDIIDYINPASCSDQEFRTMWADFEWENKVLVNTNVKDPRIYLEKLLSTTNMRCLTPDRALSGQATFLAANLYAKSVFGEDALANISLEVNGTGPVSGHLRIRTRTQGMALSLGDKINLSQKNWQ
ncbi:coatomer subunit beta-like [Sycon ciliatum]|uniref:coatomer subunit beta-like n=1 Tax=Sycon ciliatum TaxID=27933 RepID=UPI0020ADAE2D|eukprot:scpid32830/ scgid26430/ Coatomer subunit beta; Beta-coat protein